MNKSCNALTWTHLPKNKITNVILLRTLAMFTWSPERQFIRWRGITISQHDDTIRAQTVWLTLLVSRNSYLVNSSYIRKHFKNRNDYSFKISTSKLLNFKILKGFINCKTALVNHFTSLFTPTRFTTIMWSRCNKWD